MASSYLSSAHSLRPCLWQSWHPCKHAKNTFENLLNGFGQRQDRGSPTSGGQYHWVAELAPRRFALTFSWTAGELHCRIASRRTHTGRLAHRLHPHSHIGERGLYHWDDDLRPRRSELCLLHTRALACYHAILGRDTIIHPGQRPRHPCFPIH